MTSALVILKSASGMPIDGTDEVTTQTITQHLPEAQAAARVQQQFKQLGFQTGPLVGNSFSIEAKPAAFEEVFGGKVQEEETGYRFAAASGQGASRRLPLDALEPEVRQAVDEVTFLDPPDFGPTDYSAMP